ncbi:HNH endonuclease [Domibacillus mangrovi]|uniref:HNH nuclease domain-containing protein n=1 Tax=Domibacillus mangrovi TaxID=1714354 RepID=A0A1Q5P559_9BACI|nr:HNH endonuclease [Domibacillus mangrovi]OKL37357.1 hypothetical protein BLL40_07235 [Domibacillus mangrovi]
MNLTEKQKVFIDHYYATLDEKNSIATIEEMVEVFVVLYLEANDDDKRERVAYSILTMHSAIELIDLDELLDVDELYEHAAARQKKVKNGPIAAQEKRHRHRGDFSLTDAEWENAVCHFNNECAYCGKKEKLTFEHVVPFSKGGSFGKENIIPACSTCNSSKNDLDYDHWYRNQPFYDETREQRIMTYLSLMNNQGSNDDGLSEDHVLFA